MEDGYECLSNATFSGIDAPLVFRPGIFREGKETIGQQNPTLVDTNKDQQFLQDNTSFREGNLQDIASNSVVKEGEEENSAHLNPAPGAPERIEIHYRSRAGGTLMHIRNDEMYFEVAAHKDQVYY